MPFLDWVNKAQATQVAAAVPYHLLEFQSAHGDGNAENLLIQGDNLLALKALLPFYRGQVKCIYIDPPYNTQSAFEHYDDKLEHSQWLSMMHPRLVLLRDLLAEDGSIWVSIDDREAHYLKVLMDEVFGRGSFVVNVLWQKRTSPDARLHIGDAHDHVLLYAKNRDRFILNRVQLSLEQTAQFKNPDNDPRGPWTSTDFTAQGWRPNQMYKLVTPSGVAYEPPAGRCWANVESEFKRLLADDRLWFGKDGTARPRTKTFLSEHEGVRAWSWWGNSEVGHNQEAKKEINDLFGADTAFATPKPERLLHRIVSLTTAPGDLVLDSFLGSGTTAAVAHKMNRRWIGIEMGEHAVTHCLPRLEKVGAGETGGISAAVGWQGGGGFRFHRLGEAVFDADGGINPAVRYASLAAYLWHFETGQPAAQRFDSPCLGVHEGKAYYLLYNGILGDRRPAGGNVLTSNVLAHLDALFPHAGPRVIYGETTRLGEAHLRE
ncbi:MAG: site-specific DNA-methyltransferase, partial [Sulfuritalea sp.]|nr:site-specific DNA-methyltransferase [Sulfuritalea sp.]